MKKFCKDKDITLRLNNMIYYKGFISLKFKTKIEIRESTGNKFLTFIGKE